MNQALVIIQNKIDAQSLVPYLALCIASGWNVYIYSIDDEFDLAWLESISTEVDVLDEFRDVEWLSVDRVFTGGIENRGQGVDRMLNIIRTAQEQDVEIVSLIVASRPFMNRLTASTDTVDTLRLRYQPLREVNAVVMPSSSEYDGLEDVLPVEPLVRVRNERFVGEALHSLQKNVAALGENGSHQLKVMLLLPAARDAVIWDLVILVLERLKQEASYCLTVVVDREGMDVLAVAYPSLKFADGSVDVVDREKMDGFAAVEAVDVVLDGGNGLGLDALMLGKSCWFFDFLHANQSVGGRILCSRRLDCIDAFYAWLKAGKAWENLTIEEIEVCRAYREELLEAPIFDPSCSVGKSGQGLKGDGFGYQQIGEGDGLRYEQLIMRYNQLFKASGNYRRMISTRDGMIQTRDQLLKQSNHVFVQRLFAEHVEAYLRSTWRALKDDGVDEVVLFGAGRHTRWLLFVINECVGPKIDAVLDDAALENEKIRGINVCRPDQWLKAKKDLIPIVLSTDVQQDIFRMRCKQLFGDSARAIDLYEHLEVVGPYPKQVGC